MTESGSPPARKAPAKKATAKKTTAKKATAKKAAPAQKPVAKKPAPAQKPVAKKAAQRTATKKTPAKKPSAIKRGLRLDAARDLARSAPMSKYFDRARARARKMLDDPDALQQLANESYRSGSSRSGAFAGVMDDFRTLVRLVVAYARGTYREIPADSLVLVVGGLLYVVSPIDLIPDTIPLVGLMDDAVLVSWVIKAVRDELDAFRAWELGQ